VEQLLTVETRTYLMMLLSCRFLGVNSLWNANNFFGVVQAFHCSTGLSKPRRTGNDIKPGEG